MENYIGKQLIEELLSDPQRFSKEGKSYQLLQEYFKGFPLETLRPLLKNRDLYINSAAVFVVSELGSKASELIDDVIPLLNIENPYIQSDALESIMVCSFGKNVNEFIHVVYALENGNKGIRNLAMFLLSNANELQLRAAISVLTKNTNDERHKKGLLILSDINFVDDHRILKMIDDENPLIRKYGAIAAKRLYERKPELISHVLSSNDIEVNEFAQDFVGER